MRKQMESSTKELKPQTHRKEIFKQIPVLYEHQLFPSLKGSNNRGISWGWNLHKAMIVALTGPKGGIKSGSLAYIGIKLLSMGLPVYTNLPIKCYLIKNKSGNGEKILLESQPIDFNKLFMHSEELDGGAILWDEYQQWDRSGRHMTTQHQLLMGLWEQIRHTWMSFYYVAKRINLVPGDIAWETDIEINCSDITPPPAEGEKCLWQIKDLSGALTRRMFNPDNPIIYPFTFYHRAIWGAYDTLQRFDFFEAMKGVSLDLEKRVISDKTDDGFDADDYRDDIARLFRAKDRYWQQEIYAKLNIREKYHKEELTSLLMSMGFDLGYSGGKAYFRKSKSNI